MNANITIERLPRPEHQGDWHDKPLRWIATVKGSVQKFSTKREAITWARCRNLCANDNEAFNMWRDKYW